MSSPPLRGRRSGYVAIRSAGPAETLLRIGTAGWAIPKVHAAAFPPDGSGLERYAAVFNAAEINSTFYRTHRPSTFERWHDSVPDEFRFSVKIPKLISHEMRLVSAGQAFEEFVASLSGLGRKLGPLLLQLPPKLVFDEATVLAFLKDIASTGPLDLVIEPRHETWFTPEADELLTEYAVARVAADPQRAPGALEPGGSRRISYVRLHGSPKIYFSAYGDSFLDCLAARLLAASTTTWCIFDNTASGSAAGNALKLQTLTERSE